MNVKIWLLSIAAFGSLCACSHAPAVVEAPFRKTSCENLDWYEIGRTDGTLGFPLRKLEDYQHRCDTTASPVKVEVYTNGRDAGLINFCSPTGGLEAGRGAVVYEQVCPENLEKAFLKNYEVGRQIHLLESENNDLESRIENLIGLSAPNPPGGSVRAQIDQLKERQTRINLEISSLEKKTTEI